MFTWVECLSYITSTGRSEPLLENDLEKVVYKYLSLHSSVFAICINCSIKIIFSGCKPLILCMFPFVYNQRWYLFSSCIAHTQYGSVFFCRKTNCSSRSRIYIAQNYCSSGIHAQATVIQVPDSF